MPSPSVADFRKSLDRARVHLEAAVLVAPPESMGISASVAFGLLRRALDVLRAILAVADLGLVAEVGALGRILCESAYNANWFLHSNGQVLARAERDLKTQLWWDVATLDGTRTLHLLVGHEAKVSEEELREADGHTTEIRTRRGVPEGQKLKLQLADLKTRIGESVGAPGLENYDLVYRILCMDAHPSAQSLIGASAGHAEGAFERAMFAVHSSLTLLIIACFQLMERPGWNEIAEELNAPLGVRPE